MLIAGNPIISHKIERTSTYRAKLYSNKKFVHEQNKYRNCWNTMLFYNSNILSMIRDILQIKKKCKR